MAFHPVINGNRVFVADARRVWGFRRQRQRGVGDAAGDDDRRPLPQGRHDRPGPEVGVGADDAIAHRCQCGAGVEIGKRVAGGEEFIKPVEQIVARYDGDLVLR